MQLTGLRKEEEKNIIEGNIMIVCLIDSYTWVLWDCQEGISKKGPKKVHTISEYVLIIEVIKVKENIRD